MQANPVDFTPGARTVWHTHPLGQTIYVTKGDADHVAVHWGEKATDDAYEPPPVTDN